MKDLGSAYFMKIIPILLFLILFSGCFNPKIVEIKIAKWKNDAKAAYTIIHDDLCDTVCRGIYEYADTMAFNRGLRIGSGAIVNNCEYEGEKMWEHLRTMVSHGHEIACHSWDHGSPVDLGWEPESWSADTDVVISKAIIEKNVPGAKVEYFIFPYDAYDKKRLDELKKAGFLGARVGKVMYDDDRGVNTDFSEFDPFNSCYFDAYMSKKEQDEIDTLPMDERYTVSIYNDDNDDIELQHLDSALATGGWSIQEMHTVEDKEPWGWGHISVEKYRRLLDYAKGKIDKGVLWMDGPSAIIKYIVIKNQCGTPKLNGNVVSFPNSKSIDKKYATALTLLIKTKGNPKELTCLQGGKKFKSVRINENLFKMDVNPVNGDLDFTIVR